jgi:hypothetical protein
VLIVPAELLLCVSVLGAGLAHRRRVGRGAVVFRSVAAHEVSVW